MVSPDDQSAEVGAADVLPMNRQRGIMLYGALAALLVFSGMAMQTAAVKCKIIYLILSLPLESAL